MTRFARWMITLIALISLAGVVAPADAQIVIRDGRHHRHYHHRRYHRHHRHWR